VEIVVVIVVALLALGGYVGYHRELARRESAWTEFARRFGLTHDPGGIVRKPRVRGSVDGFALRLETVERRDGESQETFTRLVVSGGGRIPPDLTLGNEGFFSAVMRSIGRGDVATGDAGFDDAIRVGGDAAVALALLGHDTRRAIESAIGNGIALERGDLVWEKAGRSADVDLLDSKARELLDLANRLSIRESEIAGRLLANVRSDPSPEARRRSLEALFERYPGRDGTIEAARAALRETSGETCAIAAEALPGDEGADALAALARNPSASEAARVRALRALARSGDAARAGPAVESALASPGREPALRRAAVAAAGDLRLASALPRLIALSDGASGELAAALATAIGAIGSAEGESAALRLLARDETAVRIAAASALGEIGGRDAVAPLLSLTGGILPFGELRAAATEAVRAIQARLGPAERGGLALSDVLRADGALSEPDAPAGGLSVPAERAEDPERT